MNAKQLKNALLQHAIQGRLVPQDPGDEPADVLLQRIRAEKEQLIKEGKIKKQKPLPPITEEEKPFTIPDSWQWVRLGEIIHICSASRVHQSDWKSSGIPFYRAREIAKLADQGFVNNDLFISKALFDKLKVGGVPEENDIMVTAVGTLGKAYVVKLDDIFYYKDASVICLKNFYKINPYYIKYIFDSSYVKNQINKKSSGTTVGTITIINANNYILPLPPMAEQQRIVARLEELLPDVEAYGTAQERLTALESSFPQQLRKSLLQEAIQGRLVPQDPTDESADVLLQRIHAEKEQLITEGKIKKQKPLPPITEEEKPFAIPDSWQWVRLGELGVLSGGKTPQATDIYSSGSYPYFKVSDMNSSGNEQYLIKTSSYIGEKFKSKIFKKNSIVFPKNGGAIFTNKKRILKKDSLVDLNTGIFSCYIDPIHIFIFHIFLNIDFSRISKGTALPTIDSDKLKNILVALPPLAEQQRIVARLEELLPLCDGLLSAGGQA